ncbi:MAG: 30S ribosomal protein S20 [bacterium]|nr:30S ribosomal protein S20 [bacterium]
MAHHKSCIKRIRTSGEANERNRQYRSRMRTEIKKLRGIAQREEAEQHLRQVTSLLDRLVTKGVIKANAASNRKSALTRFVNTL